MFTGEDSERERVVGWLRVFEAMLSKNEVNGKGG